MTQSVILENPAHFAPTSQALMRIFALIFFKLWILVMPDGKVL